MPAVRKIRPLNMKGFHIIYYLKYTPQLAAGNRLVVIPAPY